MSIIITILGCLLGIAVFLLFSFVVHFKSLGDYAIGIEVAFCLIFTEIIGGFSFWKSFTKT